MRPAFPFPVPKSGKQLIELFAYLSGLEAGPKSQSRLRLPQLSDACADAQPFENHPWFARINNPGSPNE
jgi:hypothetical protein